MVLRYYSKPSSVVRNTNGTVPFKGDSLYFNISTACTFKDPQSTVLINLLFRTDMCAAPATGEGYRDVGPIHSAIMTGTIYQLLINSF